jgi:NodT family efflux transporter outer membrane factor (OMF) lipoprotein
MKILSSQNRKVWAGLGGACAAVALGMLAGCNVGPKYVPPTMTAPVAYKETPANFKETGGWTVAQPQDAALRGKWWEIYNEPELNALEEELNVDNQNIRESFESYMEARALVHEARSQLFPTVSLGASYTRSQSSSTLGSGTASGNQSQVFSLPGEVSWEPDLWGKVRNAIHSSQYVAQVTAADLANERLAEQASLAEYFFEIRGQDALQSIVDQIVDVDRHGVEVEQARYDTGVDDQITLVNSQITLQNAQTAATNLKIARAQYEHAIAMLVGKPASGFSIPVQAKTSAPPAIPVGLPSQLLERRPDVAAAERQMAAANAQIGIAYAAYYPSLTLSAGGGVESSAIKNLFDAASRFWSAGPSLSETVYDGGLRRATVNQYIATYNGDLAAYRQSVLTAFQQVEDTLAEVRVLSQQIAQQQAVIDSSQKALDIEQGRYQSGIDPFTNVVTAQSNLLVTKESLATMQVQQMTASVALIQALGGGWDRTQLPTLAQVTEKPTATERAIQH